MPTTSGGSDQTERELRTVLLGMTGVGKSSAANMIIGKEHFKSDCDGSSVTFRCDHATTMIEGREVLLVDTPGLFNTRQGNDNTMREITRYGCLYVIQDHTLLFWLFKEETGRQSKFRSVLISSCMSLGIRLAGMLMSNNK